MNGGRTRLIVADLADEAATQRAAEAVLARGLPIAALVNNDGSAVLGRFPEQALEAHRSMLQVKMLAPVTPTHRLLPALHQQPRSCILNVDSMAGYAAFSPSRAIRAARPMCACGRVGCARTCAAPASR